MKDNMRIATKSFSGFLRAVTHSFNYKGHSITWLIAMLLVILMAGCNGTVNLSDTPTVTLTSPADGSAGAAINTNITAAFSEEMDDTTIDASTFTLKQGDTAVSGTVSYSGVTAVFDPGSDLEPGTVYTARITTGAKNLGGKALESDYVWSFTTGAEPAVTITIPAADATGVAINTQIVATFTTAMAPATLNSTTFTLKRKTTGIPVPGTVTYDGKATFTPAIDLLYSTVYTATITTGATDLGGKALASDYVWDFTTTAAGLLSVSPATLTYNDQSVGTTSSTQTVTISNTGGATLTVNDIINTNDADFVLNAPATPFTINAGGTQTFTVAFRPATSGDKTANIIILSDGGNSTVSAIGKGIETGGLSLSPATLTYVDQLVGTTSATKTVTIKNSGGTALTVNSITSDNADFILAIATIPFTINAGGSQTFTVAFKPSSVGPKSATITVTSTESSQTVSATGTGTSASLNVSPATLTFADLTVGGTSLAQTVTIENTGGTSLDVTDIIISDSANFLLESPGGTSFTLNPGDSEVFTLKFTPVSPTGVKTAFITVVSTAGNKTVTATGEGI